MYPKGVGSGQGNCLSLFLNASDFVTSGPKAKTLAVYKLRVLDQLHRKHYEFGIYILNFSFFTKLFIIYAYTNRLLTLISTCLIYIDNVHRWFHYDLSGAKLLGWGWDEFLPLEKLNNPSAGLLVNDEIYISVDILLVSSTEYLWCALMDSIKTTRINCSWCWTYLPIILYLHIVMCV